MSRCKGCDRDIFFAKTPDGKKIALDYKAQIFEHQANIVRRQQHMRVVKRSDRAWALHEATCPESTEFNKVHREKFVRLEVLSGAADSIFRLVKGHCRVACNHKHCDLMREIRVMLAATMGERYLDSSVEI